MAFASLLALSGLAAPVAGWTDGVVVGKYTSFRHINSLENPEGTIPSVWAAGRNNHGQLGIQGIGTPDCWAEVSVSLEEGEEVRHVAAGAFHTLFLTTNHRLFGAGLNNKGQLGVGSGQVGAPGTRLISTGLVYSVAAGYAHTLISTGSAVYAMGWNAQGQLGTDDTQDRSEATLIFDESLFGSGKTPFAIAAGHDFSFIVAQDQTLYAFGNNLNGQLGTGNRMSQHRPIQVSLPQGMVVQYVVAGAAHAIFETSDSKLYGTGSNYAGQLSNAIALGESTHTPVELTTPGSGSARARAAGSSTCEAGDGRMDCTGDNRFGQLGLSSAAQAETFTKVHEADAWTATESVVGDYHSLFFQQNNEFDANTSTGDISTYVLATGANQYGQLGDCTMTSRNYWDISWSNVENATMPTTTTEISPTPAPVVTTAPTAAPTPAPAPVPTPAPTEPTTTRGISETGDNDMLVYAGGGATVLIILFLLCRKTSYDEAAGSPDDLEAPVAGAAPPQGGALQVPGQGDVEMSANASLQVPDQAGPTISQKDLEKQEDARAEALIKKLYEEKNPSEVGNVMVLLQNTPGSKIKFYQKACGKYGVDPEEFESEKQAELAGKYIRELYKEKNPEKLGDIEGILQKYTGLSRVQFYRRAAEKYGEVPKPMRII